MGSHLPLTDMLINFQMLKKNAEFWVLLVRALQFSKSQDRQGNPSGKLSVK